MKKFPISKFQFPNFEVIRETLRYVSGLSKICDRKTPAQLIFFVTSCCNSRCRHCFYWRELNKKLKDELNLEEIQKISRSMGRIFWLFISGGEPFIRDDLPEICQTFYQNNRVNSIIIPTNGILMEKIVKDIEIIAKSCPNAKLVIQISIDEIGERHDKIRGVPGNFAKIEKLVPELKKLQAKYKNLAIQANIVFCQYNQDRMIKIYDHLYQQFELDNICLSLVRGEPKEIGAKEVDLEKYWRAHQHLRKTRRFRQYTPLLSYLITQKEDMQVEVFLSSFRQKRAIIPCLASRQSVVLYPNGDLALCELRPEKYGNLRDVSYDFSRLWQSQKAEELRRAAQNCYCTQECVYTTNVFLNPHAWPMFLKYLIKKKL